MFWSASAECELPSLLLHYAYSILLQRWPSVLFFKSPFLFPLLKDSQESRTSNHRALRPREIQSTEHSRDREQRHCVNGMELGEGLTFTELTVECKRTGMLWWARPNRRQKYQLRGPPSPSLWKESLRVRQCQLGFVLVSVSQRNRLLGKHICFLELECSVHGMCACVPVSLSVCDITYTCWGLPHVSLLLFLSSTPSARHPSPTFAPGLLSPQPLKDLRGEDPDYGLGLFTEMPGEEKDTDLFMSSKFQNCQIHPFPDLHL